MTFKLIDCVCTKCNHVQEVLLDLRENAVNELPVCEKCGSMEMKEQLGVGVGNTHHFSWAKWRTPV